MEPNIPGKKLTVTEKQNSSNLYTIVGLDEEFQQTLGDLELEISNPEQNTPFYLTKAEQTGNDSITGWNLGVAGKMR